MNCFVIMPFAREFDDVYATVKASVETALRDKEGRCFRLDEARPAGRTTDRLLKELATASLCVADLTGTRPNVMWELGYAMALNKPTIIATQNLGDLPFDIRDMQSIEYDRSHLRSTLGSPLERMVIDTVFNMSRSAPTESDNLVGELLHQVGELKLMVAEAVKLRNYGEPSTMTLHEPPSGLANLEGAWVGGSSNSHFYAAMVGNDLLVPYCFMANQELTGAFFGWRKTRGHWFARFAWLNQPISGFAFLSHKSDETLTGEWWYDDGAAHDLVGPPRNAGVPETLNRQRDLLFPDWATNFIEQVRRDGLPSRLTPR